MNKSQSLGGHDSAESGRWWQGLTRYHWFVFAVASAAWMFDCLDQQLFLIARPMAMKELLGAGQDAKEFGGYATSIFVAGWAMGGLIFGSVGDRYGRAKTLTLTVLLYSVFTGLSAFSTSFLDFAIYRFITGLGVGGVFGLAVALVADSLPDRARPHALGVLQALSAVGNIAAGAIAIAVASMELTAVREGAAAATGLWSKLFLVGALPAFLCVFIQARLKEPEKWVKAREAGKLTGVRFGSYPALLGDPRWRGRALLAMLMCVSGVIGLWGIGFFSPELISDVIGRILQSEGVPEIEQAGHRMRWTGITMICQNTGAFLGMLTFTWAAHRFGRRPSFAVAFVCAMISTVVVFQFLDSRWHIFVLIPIMGFFQLALFAGFAIYLPELFPTNLRSTGTSFCYNVGRFLAALGPAVQGKMTVMFASGATTPAERLSAFRDACGWMSLIFLLGLAVLWFLPETRGKPLPENE